MRIPDKPVDPIEKLAQIILNGVVVSGIVGVALGLFVPWIWTNLWYSGQFQDRSTKKLLNFQVGVYNRLEALAKEENRNENGKKLSIVLGSPDDGYDFVVYNHDKAFCLVELKTKLGWNRLTTMVVGKTIRGFKKSPDGDAFKLGADQALIVYEGDKVHEGDTIKPHTPWEYHLPSPVSIISSEDLMSDEKVKKFADLLDKRRALGKVYPRRQPNGDTCPESAITP